MTYDPQQLNSLFNWMYFRYSWVIYISITSSVTKLELPLTQLNLDGFKWCILHLQAGAGEQLFW